VSARPRDDARGRAREVFERRERKREREKEGK
jgi:hypothetical protein